MSLSYTDDGCLPRWLATWNDDVTRVIHARTLAQASGLARSLVVPKGIVVVSVLRVQEEVEGVA